MTEGAHRPGLSDAVATLPGVGTAYVERLERLGVTTVHDLLTYFPRRYDDLRAVKTIDELQQFGSLDDGASVTVRATILATEARRSRSGRMIVKASIGNSKGWLEAVWFNQPYLAKQLKIDDEYIFSGKLKSSFGRPSLQSPSFEPVQATQIHVARLVPVYPQTEGLTSKWLRAKLKPLLDLASTFEDELPEDLRKRYRLPPVAEAVQQIHFPDSPEAAASARRRFDFSQLLQIQILTLRNRRNWQQERSALPITYDAAITKRMVASLPWPLTDDQRVAAHEILRDLATPVPMMRLLQGDVGSGKTAVAALALWQVAATGHQGALMAPTETLARQHFQTLHGWLAPLGVTVGLALGSDSAATKRAARVAIAEGTWSVVVGTHALIQQGVEWQSLALAVVDEQHRFGVTQREALRADKQAPHLLTMTATPIPRSLALVAYGDQDLSVIASLPAGRQMVQTEVVSAAERPSVWRKVTEELTAGRQAFVVYPVIADSAAGLRDATSEFIRLQEIFSNFTVGLLHGKLPGEEKERIMQRFQAGELQVLVATSVIEVGIDVPNATVMVIEEAQQFGLAQLHQFRGRVGRGSHQSFCYLISGTAAAEDNERLQAMTTSHSGFELAQIDLEQRGPGDLVGTKQSGFDISLQALTDPQLLQDARAAAEELLANDPDLRQAPTLSDRIQQLVLES